MRGHGGIELLPFYRRQATEFASRDFGILCGDGGADIGWHQLVTLQLGRIKPDPHRVLRTKQRDIADAFDAAERIDHIGGDVIAQVDLRHAVVLGHETQHHQKVLGGFRDHQSLLRDGGRQQRRGQLQLVLHLHLRDVGIGAAGEGQRDADAAGRITGRCHVAQAIDTLHFLFDDLGDGILDGLGRGTRIRAGNRDRRRCDARILGDRQAEDGQYPGQHDDDGDHPREDGAVYEKT